MLFFPFLCNYNLVRSHFSKHINTKKKEEKLQSMKLKKKKSYAILRSRNKTIIICLFVIKIIKHKYYSVHVILHTQVSNNFAVGRTDFF